MPINWQAIAVCLGYRDDRLMLMDLYNVRHLSALNVSLKIGVSTTAVYRRLRDLGLRVRPAKCNHAKWSKSMRAIFTKEGNKCD